VRASGRAAYMVSVHRSGSSSRANRSGRNRSVTSPNSEFVLVHGAVQASGAMLNERLRQAVLEKRCAEVVRSRIADVTARQLSAADPGTDRMTKSTVTRAATASDRYPFSTTPARAV